MSAVRRVLTVALVAIGVLLGSASPADAHAVLLRSEPAPQSTVARTPAAVRLEFSEPVETAFGAIRVYDVEGRRVDRGDVRRASGGRILDAPLRSVADGTYTVTWRIVSSDGHRISGGFVFYVGAPSTISPVAIDEEPSSSRAVGWGFGVVRFLWLSALIALIGLAAVRRMVWTPALRANGLGDSPAAERFRTRFSRALPAAWMVLVLAGAASLVFQAASVSGLPLADAAAGRVIEDVLDTTYGRAWLVQIVLAVLAVVPVLALTQRRAVLPGRPTLWLVVLGLITTGLCVTAAVSGHARTDPNPLLAETSIVVHLLAVGCWVGGLGALVLVGGPAWRGAADGQRAGLLREVVVRFSRLALVAVAFVVASGTVNAVTAMAGVNDLWDTTYGRLVSAKVVALVLALLLAARHLRVSPRRLAGEQPERAVGSFTVTSAVELVFLAAAVALAAALIAAVPGRSLALAEGGPFTAERPAGPYLVQLFVDPSDVGANEMHVTFVGEDGLAAAEVANTTVRLTPPGGAARSTAVRLIAPGHFTGELTLSRPGSYRVAVSTTSDGRQVTASFTFSIARRS